MSQPRCSSKVGLRTMGNSGSISRCMRPRIQATSSPGLIAERAKEVIQAQKRGSSLLEGAMSRVKASLLCVDQVVRKPLISASAAALDKP